MSRFRRKRIFYFQYVTATVLDPLTVFPFFVCGVLRGHAHLFLREWPQKNHKRRKMITLL